MKRSAQVTFPAFCALGLAIILNACRATDFNGNASRLNPTVTKSFVQDDYPVAKTLRKQAKAGEPGTQSFEQGEWGLLDLLIVIDNSGSMIQEQENLSTKLQPLLSRIDKSNWQIAVVTTDPAHGCQRALIRKGDADGAAKFQAAINAGTGGSGVERPFWQAVSGLKAECRGAHKWVRPGSTVSVLMVTDEDNCHIDKGQGYGCNFLPDRDEAFITSYLSSIRKIRSDARVYGLVWHPSEDATQCKTATSKATQIADLIADSSGTWGSICDSDYTKTLTAISSDIAQIVKYEFDLSQIPDAGTLSITSDDAPWTKFEIINKHVKFTEPPPFGAKIKVTYKYGAEGNLTNDFVLDKVPVDGSLKVQVNGDVVDPAHIKVDAVSKKVSFAEAPVSSADITFDYKEAVPLKATFDLGTKDVDVATLTVTVNDKPVAASGVIFNAGNGSVTIQPPPPAGATIEVSFKNN